MKKVERREIVDYMTYDERRGAVRESAMRAKAARRVHVGPHLTFLFENHETILYQVQEMTRAERMVKEADIVHEIETYNELLGGPGELGCSLLVELDSPAERAEKLTKWLALPKHLYVKRADGTKAHARYDERQVGETRVSSVQYLKFDAGSQAPIAVGCDHPDPELRHETTLNAEQRAALQADLEA
jgi:ribosomal 50S subunit-recycling heat shock protein